MFSISNIFRVLLITLLFTLNIAVADERPAIDLQKTFDQLKSEFDKSIKNTSIFEQNLNSIDVKQKAFAELNNKLEECIADKTDKLDASKKNLSVLGEKETTEARDIKTQRKELEDQVKEIDNNLKRCSLLKIQLKEIADQAGIKTN